MGCQRRRLLGSAGQCTAECVNDGTITMCANGDGCCPSGCNRNNDNNCPAVCGNGAIEMGETCDPVAMCTSQSQACVSDRNNDPHAARAWSPTAPSAATPCARPCGAATDGQCPAACMPCGATCAANQDIDCKLPNGAACTHPNQCVGGACTTFFRDNDGDGFGGAPVQVCGTTPPAGHIATGGDCCDTRHATPAQGRRSSSRRREHVRQLRLRLQWRGERALQHRVRVLRSLPSGLGVSRSGDAGCGIIGNFRNCGGAGNGCGVSTTPMPAALPLSRPQLVTAVEISWALSTSLCS